MTDKKIVDQWKELLIKENGQKLIAINWHGSALKSTSEVSTSDIDLEYFSCLTTANNIKLISLQKELAKRSWTTAASRNTFTNNKIGSIKKKD